jgi:opacity protein-like surface antigen
MVMNMRLTLKQGRRLGQALAALLILSGVFASPASAQVVRVTRADAKNAVGFNLGYFAVKGIADRVEGDVLIADLDSLAFDLGDFSGFTFGGEWLYGVGDYLETGVGVGYYQKSVPSVYRDLVNTNGSEIAQQLKLKIVPITATVRFLPIGRTAPVQPYVGAGLGIFAWKYSEVGEFVDENNDIFSDRFIGDGTAFGPVVLAGLRFPVGDAMTTGVEFRWQKAEGDTSDIHGLLGDKIDLGGWTTSWTMHFRF